MRRRMAGVWVDYVDSSAIIESNEEIQVSGGIPAVVSSGSAV
jgi:hypothetical protein